jgi:threonine aldolase
MAQAVVGDDVFQEDPTLNDLEAMAAEKTGKEEALFVPSGTMGNLISVLAHCARGDEVILGDRSHIFLNEVAGMSALGGIHPHIVPSDTRIYTIRRLVWSAWKIPTTIARVRR